MLIGIDTSALTQRITGTSRYISCLLTELEKSGNDIRRFAPGKEINLPILHSMPFFNRGGMRRHLYRKFELSSELKSAGTELAIFPNYLMPLSYNGRSAIVIHDLSFISHPQFYSRLFVKYYTSQLKKTIAKRPLVITISESTRESIHQYLGIDRKNIFVIQGYSEIRENNCTDQVFNSFYETDSRPYFLYVGHIEPRKNLTFLINNFLEWKLSGRMNYRLIIAGELWLRSKEINNLLHKYGSHSDIEFGGYVCEEELHRLYANASAFVHAGIVEGFGFPVLEAMHYNLPILCSSGTGTEEISSPQSILFNPYNAEELKAGFDKIICLLRKDFHYNIKYSSTLMRNQLEELFSSLNSGRIYKPKYPQMDTETAVEKTLLYYKLFNSGINKNLIHQFLIEKYVSGKELDAAIKSLLSKGVVYQSDNTLHLKSSDIAFYNKTDRKLDKNITHRLLKFINKVPFISSISFSGGTANYGLMNHDDIDLFIITRPYTVYIVYFILHIFSLLQKSRKILCTNYLIDEKALYINTNQDIYTAHQIIALKPYKNESLLNNFLSENKWINLYFPNFNIPNPEEKQSSPYYILFSPINSLINRIYRKWYKRYLLSSRNNSIVLNEHVIKLHTNDYRGKVIKEFEHQWNKYSGRKQKEAVLI